MDGMLEHSIRAVYLSEVVHHFRQATSSPLDPDAALLFCWMEAWKETKVQHTTSTEAVQALRHNMRTPL